jgi:hypothetical protein
MRVAVVVDTANYQQFKDVLHSFAKGCGGDITNSDDIKGYDCAVIYGSHKQTRGSSAQQGKRKIIKSGIPYIQLETQLIGRPIHTPFLTEFRVGVNGFLWDDADWGFEHIRNDRSKKVFERNGYDPEIPWKQDGDYILLCMQKVGDASLRGCDIFSWTEQTVKHIRQYTERQIVVRPHPLYRKKGQHARCKETVCSNHDVVWQETDVRQEGFVPIQKQLINAWCTVTYSSGTGIDAVINGVPNVACDSGSMVYEVSSKDIAEIESPYRGDKKQWTNKIAHCQWSVDEFESGECWEHVNKILYG